MAASRAFRAADVLAIAGEVNGSVAVGVVAQMGRREGRLSASNGRLWQTELEQLGK
jgi:hypothetical protein